MGVNKIAAKVFQKQKNPEVFNQLVNEYMKNNMTKLIQLSNQVLSKMTDSLIERNVSPKDYDDFYDIAVDVLAVTADSWDGVRDFRGFLYDAVRKKFCTKLTSLGRIKRTADTTAVSLNEEVDEEGATREVFLRGDSGADDQILDGIPNDELQRYLNGLSGIQRKVLDMYVSGYSPEEIQGIMKIPRRRYNEVWNGIRAFEKTRFLGRDSGKCNKIKEEKVMEMSSERTAMKKISAEAMKKKIEKMIIRDNHVLQRESGQWSAITKSELVSDILHKESFIQVIIDEEIRGNAVWNWLIDGKQRVNTILEFLSDRFAISRKIQQRIVEYPSNKTDENGKLVLDEGGFPIQEFHTFDIGGKKFSQLPEELQDRFSEFEIPVLMNLQRSRKEVAHDIIRFNRCRPMNVAQNGWTGLAEEWAEQVDNILKLPFFEVGNPVSSYKETNRKSGAMRRMAVESIMAINYLDDFSKEFQKNCMYLSEEGNMSCLIDFYDMVSDLGEIVTDETADFFTASSSFIWFALFARFRKLGVDSHLFRDFLIEFKKTLHSKTINGTSFDELGTRADRQKYALVRKLNLLERLMKEFLHIDHESNANEEATENATENNEEVAPAELESQEATETTEVTAVPEEPAAPLDLTGFLQQTVDPAITEDDKMLYEQVLDDLTLNVNNDTPLLEEANHPSLVAMVAWSFHEDKDLDEWIVSYFAQNDSYDSDQVRNLRNMKDNFEWWSKTKTEKNIA